MSRPLPTLASDRSGAAATEFALWAALFFMVALGAFDLADLYWRRSQMSAAVSAASIEAFNQREDVNFADLGAYVRALADRDSIEVSVACNGTEDSCTNLNRTCACLRQTGTYVARTCGEMCTGTDMTEGVTAGYYLTITATEPFSPVLVPDGLTGSVLSQSATVRLE